MRPKKAKPIRQLMVDLPSFRVTAVNKPFKFCGTDYFGPILYKQNRSQCKARGLLFTCLCTARCVHVEVNTGLDLNNFILSFSRLINLRGPVDTFFSDHRRSQGGGAGGSTTFRRGRLGAGRLGAADYAPPIRRRDF